MMAQLLQHSTILIVDDSESDRSTYSRYLQADQERQYRIIESETFEEGLEMWRSQQPDLVLIDLNLPDGDGLEFLEAIDADRAGERVPAIVLTGQGTEKKAVSAMKLGAADYLVKGDITAKSIATAVRQVLRETTLRRQLLRSQQQQAVIAEMALRIRELLNLEDISNAIVKEVRQFIHADRAAIYQFNPDMSGKIVAENIASPWQPCLNVQVEDTCFQENLGGAYCAGRIFVANDIYAANLTDCHIQLLERFQVRANLVVPILLSNEDKRSLWGLLIVHQCSAPRVWQDLDIQLLQQLSVHLEIAIQQAIAYQQLQAELAERKRVEILLLNQQAELEERNELLERISEELQCTVEELRAITGEQIAQHRLLEYEQSRYQTLFDFAPDGYLVTDLSGKILKANQVILNLLAISHVFIVGKPLVVFIDSAHRDIFYTYLNHISSLDNTKTTWEITLKARQGIPFPAEITVIKNINLANDETQLFWMIRDISDRKRTEQELLQLNQSLEAKVTERTQAIQLQSQMLEQIHDAIISTTLEGTILTWNIGAERLYEYESNEAIGQNVSML
ncbi:response regulator [Tumidithrix elongata RA019]|uniref:Response regulator n=1 Tax=Tumidithrix elongata BACA0141 TaxID=2716417 RepID=A0AAW9Q4X2_9CYAN|nr:response regulator [Tumidithrix elongata RA019]